MKLILKFTSIVFAMFFVTQSALAEGFLLTRQSDGAQFFCGSGGSGGGASPDCISEISSYCYSKTSRSQNDCFDSAMSACSYGASPECVSSTSDYCYSNTSHSADECYDRAISVCTGSSDAVVKLAESVKSALLVKMNKGISIKNQKVKK